MGFSVTDSITVNCSPTAKSLPIRVGLRNGIFARHGLSLRLVSTDNSREQRNGLARGDFDLVHVAADNAVAMKDVDGADVVIVLGGDSGMNELFVQPKIDTVAGIRGGRLVVDAPDTAFALQAYRILADAGLQRDVDYTVVSKGRGELRIEAMLADEANSAAVLNLPYSLQAREQGLRSLGDTTAYIGPYQAGSAFVMRAWAETHRDVLVRYIAAYLECLTFVLDATNHEACTRILVEEIGASEDVASKSVVLLREPSFGLEPTAAIDEAGFRNMLALRASTQGGSSEVDLSHYVDLTYYRAARSRAGSGDASSTGKQ